MTRFLSFCALALAGCATPAVETSTEREATVRLIETTTLGVLEICERMSGRKGAVACLASSKQKGYCYVVAPRPRSERDAEAFQIIGREVYKCLSEVSP